MMKDPREQIAEDIMKHIHDVLWNEWDPIGVNDAAPKDEYDSYISGVYRLPLLYIYSESNMT